MKEIPFFTDAYTPKEIAQRITSVGVSKAKMDGLTLLLLSVLAGAFISLGALFFTVVMTTPTAGFGIMRLIGGLSFCLGLILVVVAGAELFTGNNLIAMAWASGLITTGQVMRNWVIVYCGNIAGCLGTAFLATAAGTAGLEDGGVKETALLIAQSKADLSLMSGFSRGILCNALVCLAVWLAMGGRSVTDKILAVIFPITAFVAMGFEHSIANWFFLPFAIILDSNGAIPITGVLRNILSVTAGNLVGGTVLVAIVYWLAYLRGGHED